MSLQASNTKEPRQIKSVGSTIESGFCEKHGSFEGKIYVFGKTKVGPHCPSCEDDLEERRKKIEEDERIRELEIKRDDFIRKSGIPKRFTLSSFDKYDTGGSIDNRSHALKVAKKYCEAFESRMGEGCSLVFCGLPGTGKTHLACAIGNELLNRCLSVKYTTTFNAIANVKATFGKHSELSERQAISEYQKAQLLILDEVGVQYGSDTEKIILYQIINGRYENVLPTIMISNLPEKELADYIGIRCLDRMREGGGAVVSFDWQSYRK